MANEAVGHFDLAFAAPWPMCLQRLYRERLVSLVLKLEKTK
jgi:hypothetical protein